MNIFFKLPDWVIFKSKCLNAAFSLVEMLMALLVASLLLAALAPVMTKKMDENVFVSGTGRNTSEHYAVFDDVSKNGTEDNTFTIPSNAVNVRVTMIGGGGAGGGATFGSKIITASENNWKVPDGVKKIRVYMLGGGGGGASGGIVLANQLGNLAAGYKDYLTPGSYSFKISSFLPAQEKYIPKLDSRCEASGTFWETNIETFNLTATACGAGGGGGGTRNGGGGGSGAYVTSNIQLGSGGYGISVAGVATAGGYINAQPAGYRSGAGGGGGGWDGDCNSTSSKTTRNAASGGATGGAGGKGGVVKCGFQATNGTDGGGVVGTGPYAMGGKGMVNDNGWGEINGNGGNGGYFGGGGGGGSNTGDCGGGGGGGATSIANNETNQFMASGGGGGGGAGGSYNNGGGGGAGGGWNGGGGGGAGGYRMCSPGGGSGKGGGASGAACGTCVDLPDSTCYGGAHNIGGGGGGGGYPNGVSGDSHFSEGYGTNGIRHEAKGGTITTIFGSDYCNGGDANQDGKPGALRVSWNAVNNALKCKYNTYSNGASGGGGGQVWIGEVNVTPGSYLNFHIGKGGERQTNYSSNGNNGESTYITNQSGTTLVSVSGGGGGKYSNASNISTSVGVGGGKLTSNWSDWTGQNTNTTGGLNGSTGQLSSNGSGGGKGGGVYFMDGSYLDGGNAGNAESNGVDALNYGSGGGGGGGVANEGHFPGYGGKGGDGYIYIEWGDTNGGGGSSGEIKESTKIVSATAGTKIEIEIGEGGIASNIEYDSDTKYKPGAKGENGKDTKVIIKGKTYSAKGGIGGDGGGLNKGEHGKGGILEVLNAKSYEGLAGINNYGGMGATAIYEFAANGEGIGGCGGNMIAGKCFSPSETPYGKDGAKSGSGGGGGAVKNSIPFKGGNGADGIVIIEWEEFRE